MEEGPTHEANCALLCNESWTVVIAAAAGCAIVLGTALLHPAVRAAWRRHLPLGRRRPFDFNTAWASNFAVAGAILDSILGANASDTSPGPYLSWHSFQLLGILFAAAVVLAPFTYRGTARSFVFATGLTLAAVIGQAGTSIFITLALGRQAAKGGDPVLVSYLLVVVLLISAGFIVTYVWNGIPKTIKAYEDHVAGHHAGRPPQSRVQLSTDVQALLDQHSELEPLAEAIAFHEHIPATDPPLVPLPA